MPKKVKLTDLKVQSFVTGLSKSEEDKAKGGISGTGCYETYVCATRLCTTPGICTMTCPIIV